MKVYLDNNATTPLHPEVIEELKESMHLYGNPSSHHSFGREARKKIEKARETIAEFIGAEPKNIIFTSCGSEANNTVLKGSTCCCAQGGCCTAHNQIITSVIEHSSILSTCKCIGQTGGETTYIGVDKYGIIKLDELKNAITDKTSIVSIMMANNEIGTIQPIKEIAEIVHKYGKQLHVDAVQALGKIPVNVDDLGVDFLTISAHKIYGPKGIGALYMRKKKSVCALIDGGHQEGRLRAGTENTLGIIGFGKAVECAKIEMPEVAARVSKLRDKLQAGIVANVPDILINGHQEHRLPTTTNISFKGIEGEGILMMLNDDGIMASTGSACDSDSLEPSHVLLAIGLSHQDSHGSIRFSLGRNNTEEEIDYVIEKVPPIISRLREMSPLYNP